MRVVEMRTRWTASARNFQLGRMTETLAWQVASEEGVNVQSFQVLLQFGLVKYAGNTSLIAGGVRNENTKKGTANTVMRSGSEKNAPVILLIPVSMSASADI